MLAGEESSISHERSEWLPFSSTVLREGPRSERSERGDPTRKTVVEDEPESTDDQRALSHSLR
ncbi:hypothetical protein Hmuk_1266 [Halomicrobium mukohataei DSM 12286]|uniref:Uncharacterized protein n=1 Tax=Halomicrobium mukohataei (strain ATCC 700874 / DSM 12286 / JCM 9738 / NCIMB 13541) TaxID=485914 RepID=C7P2R5_HALMD|nr:hypothetical protein Hmuk_1266 [Halomicrobium mukohataei DSM 12286]